MRAVAILLVLLVHAINVGDFRVRDGIDRKSAWISHLLSINEFGACGVDLFFVLSGFLTAMLIGIKPREPLAFARDRFIRVVPLYWMASTLFALILLLLRQPIGSGAIEAAITVVPIRAWRYDTPILIVGWSLAFEVAFYALAAAAMVMPTRWRVRTLLATVVGLGMVGRAIHPPPGLAAIFANAIQLEFAIGILVYMIWTKASGLRRGGLAAAALLIIGIYLIGWSGARGFMFSTPHMPILRNQTGTVRAVFWGVPWGLVLLGSLLTAPVRDRWVRSSAGRAILLVGDASYALYLTHMMVFVAVQRLLPGDAVAPDAMIASAYAAALAAGVAAHLTLEKPLLARLRGRRSYAVASAFSASTVSPLSVTSAKPPSTRMRAETLFCAE